MTFVELISVLSGIASIISLFVAIWAKMEVSQIKKTSLKQSGRNNRQAGRDVNG